MKRLACLLILGWSVFVLAQMPGGPSLTATGSIIPPSAPEIRCTNALYDSTNTTVHVPLCVGATSGDFFVVQISAENAISGCQSGAVTIYSDNGSFVNGWACSGFLSPTDITNNYVSLTVAASKTAASVTVFTGSGVSVQSQTNAANHSGSSSSPVTGPTITPTPPVRGLYFGGQRISSGTSTVSISAGSLLQSGTANQVPYALYGDNVTSSGSYAPVYTYSTASGQGTTISQILLQKANPVLVNSNGQTGASTTLTSGNVGDLIVCLHSGQGAQNPTMTMSDGTNSLTGLTQSSILLTGSTYLTGQVFYLLSSAGAGKTYTATDGGLASTETACFDFYASTGTWHFDAANQSSGNSTSVDTGAITTTGTAEAVVFLGKLANVAASTSVPLIAGATPLEPGWSPISTNDHMYYKLLSGTFTNGHGTKTYSTSTFWVAHLAAFYAQ